MSTPRYRLLLLLFVTLSSQAVEIRPLAELTQTTTLSAPATVLEQTVLTLSTEVSGRIMALPVAVGERVSSGGVVARIDCRSPQQRLQLSQAEGKLLQAQLPFNRERLQRAKSLTSNIPTEEREQRQMSLAMLEAQLEANQITTAQAQLEVERCLLTAPTSGIVLTHLMSSGEWAALGTPLLKLVSDQPPELEAALAPTQLASLQQAATIEFILQQQRYPLKLRTPLPYLDPKTHQQPVRLTFTAPAALAGSSGRIEWRDHRRYLPPDYLLKRGDQVGVMVDEGGVARFIALEGAQEGRSSVVTLDPATRIITQGQHALTDGTPLSRPQQP